MQSKNEIRFSTAAIRFVSLAMLAAAAAATQPALAVVAGGTHTYAGADFGAGTMSGTEVSGGKLVLTSPTPAPDSLYVSNRQAGQVLVINTTNGTYTTVPSVNTASCTTCASGTAALPTSIAVDVDGNAWVVNTAPTRQGSVTRLGPTPLTVAVGGTNKGLASAIAVDSDGTVWVGAENQLYHLSQSGSVIGNAIGNGNVTPSYLVAGDDYLYLAGINLQKNKSYVVRVDRGGSKDSVECTGAKSVAVVNGTVWAAGSAGLAKVTSFSSSACNTVWSGAALDGIAVDGTGNLWAASPAGSVYKFSSTSGALQQTYTGFTSIAPSGIGIAADGNVWVIGHNGFQKLGGAATSVPSPAYLDASSDMTGFQVRRWLEKGTWDVVQDAQFADAAWGTVTWTGAASGVTAQVRVSNSLSLLASAAWTPVTSGALFSANGQYLEVQLTLTGKVGQPSPAIDSVTVSTFGKPNGAQCSSSSDCYSNACTDGYCCSSACSGQCESCAVPGYEGTCVAVTGAPVGRPACGSDGSACGGTCDGTNRAGCSYPDQTTTCRDASCSSGVETYAAACNGGGSCGALVTKACDAYVCGANACLTSCTTDADCAAKFICEPNPDDTKSCVADVNPPVLTLDSLPAYTNQATRVISGSVVDRSNLEFTKLLLNGVPVEGFALNPDGTFSISVTFTNGTNALSLQAKDIAGNEAAPLERTTFLDGDAPVVTIASPAEGAAFGSSLGIPFSLSVSDATPVTVSAGGNTFVVTNGVATGTVDFQGGDSRPEAITFLATDAAGNVTTVSVNVLLDLNSPIVTVDDQTPVPAQTRFATVPVTLHVDDLGATTIAFSDGFQVTTPRGGGTVSYAFQLSTEGTNVLSVTVRNEGGHSTTSSWSVLYDKTPPAVAFTSPAERAFVRGGIELTVEATDNLTGVAGMSLTLPDGQTHSFSGSPATASFDTTSLQDGAYSAQASAVDGAGNSASASRSIVVDNTPPTVSIGGLTAGAYVKQAIIISADASDSGSGIDSVVITVNGTELCRDTACPKSFDTNSLGQDGPFTVQATAVDRAGNSATQTLTATAVNSAPKGFLAAPAPGGIATGTLVVRIDASSDPYFKDVSCAAGGKGLGNSTSNTASFSFDTLQSIDGSVEVACTATDLAGNTATETRTVTARNWSETFNPTTLNLKTGNQSVATVYVEGSNAALLVGRATQVSLKYGGRSLGNALSHPASAATGDYNQNGIPDLTLKFDRPMIVSALKAAGANGNVKLDIYVGSQCVGQTTIQVTP